MRPIHRLWLLVMAASIALAASPSTMPAPSITDPPRLVLKVWPSVMLTRREDIRVEARVPRNPENRLLAIAWVSDVGSQGSTLRKLEGDDALVLHTLWLRTQPAANYVFRATVFNRLGQPRARAEARIRVPDEGGDR
jgi:hypothetical protein